jgi:hypothetical protein
MFLFLRFRRLAGRTQTLSGLNLAGAEGFEPPSSVLETDSLAVELTPLKAATRCQPPLFRFLVRLVLAAAVTKLLELQTASGRLFVLRRRVIPLLALSALQCHNFPHFNSFRAPRSAVRSF